MAKLHVSESFSYVNCRRKFGNIAWQTAGALELLQPKRGATAHAFGRSRLALPTSHESHESHDRIPKPTLDKLHQQSSGPVWWRMKKRQLFALLRPSPKRKFSRRFCQWGHLFLTGPTMIWGKRIPTCKFHWQAWRSAVPPKSLLPEMDFLLLSVGQLIEALMYFPQSRIWHIKKHMTVSLFGIKFIYSLRPRGPVCKCRCETPKPFQELFVQRHPGSLEATHSLGWFSDITQ